MTLIQTFRGTSSNGTDLTAVYAEQPAAGTAIALVLPGNDLPRLVHWGRPLSAPETVLDAFDAIAPQRVSGALDYTAWPSVLPTQSESWIGATRFDVRRNGVELFCKFVVTDIKAETVAAGNTYDMTEKDGYPNWNVASEPKQTPTVTVVAEDVEQCVKLTWTCELDETGLVRQHAQVTNTGDGQLEVGKVELAFTVPADANEILTTTGHHLHERSPQRQNFTIGRFAKSSMVGRPDFDATLLLNVGEQGFGFTHGNVYSAHVAWSGNSVLSAERLPYTTGVIGGGEVLFGGEISLACNESYTTPWLVGSYGEGLNEVASRFHGYIRRVHRDWLAEHNIAPKPRPVILNTWEAVYFNHDYDTLTALADKAVESGVERFVVDDGWFGSRRDDTSGLGDWQISQDVWPDGDKSLKALADYVHGKGLEFGLWFEPEMVNPDSDLYRAHPDWALSAPDRKPYEARNQLVLDFSRRDVVDYIKKVMYDVIANSGAEYIKWDMNRSLSEDWSHALPADREGEVQHRYVLGVYELARFLTESFPDIFFEGCTGGGGRFDAAVLTFFPQIWTSDNTDAYDRVRIQYGTELIYPISASSNHVSLSPNIRNGRIIGADTRRNVAYFGSYGYEFDVNKVPADELERIPADIKKYREIEDLMQTGDLYRGKTTFDGDCNEMIQTVVSKDRRSAVAIYFQALNSLAIAPRIRIPGLADDVVYSVEELGLTLPGIVLRNVGLALPRFKGDFGSLLLTFKAVD